MKARSHSETRSWFLDTQIKRCTEALEANGFSVSRARDRSEAQTKVLDLISPGARVALGGSVTLQEIGIAEALRERGNEVEPYPGGDPRKRLTADTFLSSTNALTLDGKLVNVDGSGTRVNAMIFGPGQVIVVAGINKLVTDADRGLWRTRNVAAPMVYYRKRAGTPCSQLGYCTDCRLPQRQCRVTTVLDARPRATEKFDIVIVEESLGY